MKKQTHQQNSILGCTFCLQPFWEYEHFLMHYSTDSWFLAHSSTLGNMIYSTLFFGFLLYYVVVASAMGAFANITLLHKYWIHFASNVFSTFCNEWGALCLPISSLYIFHYHSPTNPLLRIKDPLQLLYTRAPEEVSYA